MKVVGALLLGFALTPAWAEESVARKVGETAREVKDGVTQGLRDFGEFVNETADKAKDGAQKTAKKVGDTANEIVEDVKEGYESGD